MRRIADVYRARRLPGKVSAITAPIPETLASLGLVTIGRYKSRLGQDKGSKTPGDGVTPAILQRSEAKPEHVVTWGFAGTLASPWLVTMSTVV